MNGNLSQTQHHAARFGTQSASSRNYGMDSLDHFSHKVDAPLSSSASTSGSFQQHTAWRTSNARHGTGFAGLSSNTRGTTVNWDNPQVTPRVDG